MCSKQNWFAELKETNFGLSSSDIEDLESIIGKFNPYTDEEHGKIVKFLIELDKLNINRAESLKNNIKILRKKFKYDPSRSKLTQVYFRDILWSNWANSQRNISTQLSHNLMYAFLECNSVQGSYGLVNLTIVTPPLDSCEYKCKMCPHGPIDGPLKAPISYLPNEPAVARAARVNYNIIEQIRTRIKDLCVSGVIHRIFQENNTWKTQAKVDIRLAGGTFNSYPIEMRDQFIQSVYYAVRTIDYNENQMPKIMSLDDEIEHHVSSKNQGVLIVGLSIETRPDEINDKEIEIFNKYYLTWIELGFQSSHDKLLKIISRGHKVIDSEKAIAKLKGNMGVKVLGHFMQDLPGTTPEMDIQDFEDKIVPNNSFLQNNLKLILLVVWTAIHFMFKGWSNLVINTIIIQIIYIIMNQPKKIIYSMPHLCDHIKIYPTMRLPHTEIEKWGLDKWDPYAEKDNGQILMHVLCTIVSKLPPWVRIARLVRDFHIATEKNQGMGYVSDTIKSNMAQMVDTRLKKEAPIYNEIKSREVRNNIVDLNKLHFKINSYECSVQFPEYAGREYFGSLEAPDNNSVDRLVGLFRLRLNNNSIEAKLREVHVYGGYIPKGFNPKENSKIVQHRGYGKRLINIAEMISYFYGYRRVSIISAPGTVQYYIKRGYNRRGRYLVKDLNFKNFITSIYKEICFRIE